MAQDKSISMAEAARKTSRPGWEEKTAKAAEKAYGQKGGKR